MIESRLCDDIISTIKKFRKLSDTGSVYASRVPHVPHACDGFCEIIRGAMVGICTKARRVRLLSDLPIHECSPYTCILVAHGDSSVCSVSGQVYPGECQLTPTFSSERNAPLYNDAHYANSDYDVLHPRMTDDQRKRRWMDPDYERTRNVRPKTELDVLNELCKNEGKRKQARSQEKTLLVSPLSYLTRLEEKRAFDKWVKDLEDEMMNNRQPKLEESKSTNMAKERAIRAEVRLSAPNLAKQTRKRKQVALDAETTTKSSTGILAKIYKKFFDCAKSVITEVFVVLPAKSEIDNLARAFVYIYSVVMDHSTIDDGACYRFSVCVLALLLLCGKSVFSYLPALPVHREGIEKRSMALLTKTKQIDINNCLRFLVGRLSQCESSIEFWDRCKVKPGARLVVLRVMIQKATV